MSNIIDVSVKPSRPSKVYLGDGTYAQFDGFHLILTTENGIETTNTVYLEDWVFNALLRYAEEIGWKRPQE